MNKKIFYLAILFLIGALLYADSAYAPWIWTPETKKFVNPKNAVKDTPKEQFNWAMTFYDSRDYQRAAFEFEKLAKQYEFSDYASKAQYYVGLCYENMNKYYTAFENYQKAIDNFPHLANMDEVLARQYAIGLVYLEKPSPKVMGNDIMAPLDRAVEIFKKVVENAPYGKYAEDAQFKLGEALKKSERYEEAVQAYHKLVEDYPNSKYSTQAMYEESHCAYKASLKPAYDATATDNAIKTFEKFVDKNKDQQLAEKAGSTMRRLKDNIAQKSFDIAQFYESQGKVSAAIIYYQDVIDSYPDSSFVDKAKAKIEALKSPKPAKIFAPLDFGKKSGVEIEKPRQNTWRPFNFSNKKKDQVPVVQDAPPVEPAENIRVAKDTVAAQPVSEVAQEAPEIEQPTEKVAELQVKEDVVKEEPLAQEIQTVNADEFLETNKETVAAEPVAELITETPRAEQAPGLEIKTPKEEIKTPEAPVKKEKKGWMPLNFSAGKEKAAKKEAAPKKTGWKPFSFDWKKEPAAAEPKKKTPWKPLSFENKKESSAEAPQKKAGWIPLNFDSKKDALAGQAVKEGWKPWQSFSFVSKKSDKDDPVQEAMSR